MRWPLVWRSRFEALELEHTFCAVRYADLERRYDELRGSADQMLEAVLKPAEKPAEESDPEKTAPPRRLLGKELRALATDHFKQRYEASKVKR